MEACGAAVSPLEKTSGVCPVTSNDMSGEKNSESKRRLVIRIPFRSKKPDNNDGSIARINPSPVEEDEEKKREPWNLRHNDGSTVRLNPSPVEEDEEKKREPWKLRPRKGARPWCRAFERNTEAKETKTKKEIPVKIGKLPVALSREEIEEDLAFLMVGNRPRTMQKRPRSVHQRKDDLFPCELMGTITSKSYNVH